MHCVRCAQYSDATRKTSSNDGSDGGIMHHASWRDGCSRLAVDSDATLMKLGGRWNFIDLISVALTSCEVSNKKSRL